VKADVIVIGAGAAGLACARALHDTGRDVVVLEARNRIGGRIRTLRDVGSRPFEIGAMFVHGARAAVLDVAAEAGLTVSEPRWRGGRTLVEIGGEVLPMRAAAGGWWGLEREVAALGGPDRALADVLVERGWPQERRLMAAELFAQFWCADPGRLSVEGVARVEAAWTSGPENLVIREGYDRVADHLAAGLRIELGAAVQSIGWSRGAVRIVSADGLRADASAVVVSVPPSVVAAGRPSFDPPLPASKADAVRSIPIGSVIRVVARLRHAPPESGTLVRTGADGGFWSISGDDELVTVWIGGPSAVALSGADPTDIVLRAKIAFPWLDGGRLADVRMADWGRDPFALGGYSYPRAGALDAPGRWAEPVDATLFFCGEATCGDRHPQTVHGAIESGRRAAEEIVSASLR
jgi:monoamine oxidase